MTSRTAHKRKATARAANPTKDPLERALLGGPRCQCECQGGCRRRATCRVSFLCAVEGCGSAVHTALACTPCKDSWLHQASHDPTAPELRVTPL
ncbi:MAG TPA: hypothetical protein VFV89_16910 [Nocardioides sp.]|uniref:hypothetical protein n=1 Tax=Nocardioides sp. TaxID=35761 RepID=UPI002E3223EC|nr:hypothetical protein [Nocardioides sp.]HEX5089489.1 hypothetical protein [Nocardioides sp.]